MLPTMAIKLFSRLNKAMKKLLVLFRQIYVSYLREACSGGRR